MAAHAGSRRRLVFLNNPLLHLLVLALLAMTIKAQKFTPEVLISAPRRSAGVPNADASKVLYTVSTYSFADHASSGEVRVLDTASGESTLVTDNSDASEPTWLDDKDILLLLPGANGTTDVVVGPYDDFANSNYTAGNIDGSASSVKVADIGDGKFAFAITAQAKPDGTIYNSEKAKTPASTGRYYEAIFVRHWDTYITPNRNAIFYGALSKDGDKYSLSTVVNALQGTKLESPVPPFGSTDNFDVSKSGIAFVAKDPTLNPAIYTKINVYLVPLTTFTESAPPAPLEVSTAGFQGQSTSPAFSPDGKSLAFLRMREIQYESDKLQLFIVPDVARPGWTINALATPNKEGAWDRSPSAVTWSADGKTLYLTAENIGRVSLYSYPTPTNITNGTLPELIFHDGAVSDARALSTGDVFISGTNLIDNSVYFLWTPGKEAVQVSSNSKNGALFGLSRDQISEIWYPGAANGTKIHAWVLKPSNFTEDQKWPLAYLIHGGPQGSWEDSWSTRWNPAVYAEQGYVVVTPNPTGSTGYGKKLTDDIQGNWGGTPYEDLVNGFKYIEENLPYVDTDRAVELGASYGGFMTNWIQGHDLGRKFKALVTHDGVFNMAAQTASEEIWFPEHDLEGPFWANRASWLEWDPSAHADKWATPHLIIHNELDYRLTIAEGLAAFNILQGRGVESAFLSFPNENHWVLKPENSLVWHTAVFDWINGHVGLPKYSEQSEYAKEVIGEAFQNRKSDLGLKV